MKSERKIRLLKGIGVDSISQISQMLIRFAEVPLLLYFWGVNLYGEWLIITALPTYLSISDFGFTHVAARQVIMQAAKGDKNEALVTYQSSSVLVAVTSSAIALLFFLVIWLLPVRDLFQIENISGGDLLIIAALFGIKIIVNMQSGMLGSALQATGHYPMFFILMAGISLVEFLLLAITVAMGGEPATAAGVMLAAIVVGMFFIYIAVRRVAPWFHFGLKSFRLDTVRKLAKPAFAALSFPASNALNYQGIRLIIGSVLGPSAVAVFVPHRQLAGFVTRADVLGKSIVVELGLAYGANDLVSFKRLALQSVQILLWGAMAAAIIIGLVAWFVFPWWTGGKLLFDPSLFALLLFVAVFEVVWRAAFFPAASTNRHITLAKIVLIVNIGILLPMYVLSVHYGLMGASLALLIGGLAMVVYSIKNMLVIINASGKSLISQLTYPPVFLLRRKQS